MTRPACHTCGAVLSSGGDWKPAMTTRSTPVSHGRLRLRYLLLAITLLTLPCYCAGLIAVGAATGDVFTLMQGSTHLLKDLAGSAAETEYAPPKDEAYGGTDGWAPGSGGRSPVSTPTMTASESLKAISGGPSSNRRPLWSSRRP